MIRGLFPGSFDPITLGHVDLIKRSCELFDEVVILVSESSEKKYLFNKDQRKSIIDKVIESELPQLAEKIKVESASGLTVNEAQRLNIKFLIRGLRNALDIEHEFKLEFLNQLITKDVETVYLASKHEHKYISSSAVREALKFNGPIESLVPRAVVKELKNLL